MSTKKLPVGLTLHVDFSHIEAKGWLVASSFFDCTSSTPDDEDKTMIFCAGLLPGKSAIAEAVTMRQSLLPNCDIQYYQPKHEENPTRFSSISDDGVDESIDGVWACIFTAPNLIQLGQTFDSFVEHFMGIGKPIKDNFFRHAAPTHRYISRKNRVNGRSWETRYQVKFEMKASVTQYVNIFATRMMRNHPWLTFAGTFMHDPLQTLGRIRNANAKAKKKSHSDGNDLKLPNAS